MAVAPSQDEADHHSVIESAEGGLTHQKVLVDCDGSLKRYLGAREVAKALADHKLMPKKLARTIGKLGSSEATELLLGWLKNKPVGQFAAFLEALSKTGLAEGRHTALIKALGPSVGRIRKKGMDGETQKVVSGFVALAKSLPDVTDRFDLPPDEGDLWTQTPQAVEAHHGIETVVVGHGTETSQEAHGMEKPLEGDPNGGMETALGVQRLDPTEKLPIDLQATVTSSSSHEKIREVDTAAACIVKSDGSMPKVTEKSDAALETESRPILASGSGGDDLPPDPNLPALGGGGAPTPTSPFPPGYILPCVTESFTREEGGELFCPAHGIHISIPANAAPENVTRFVISMHVYLKGPFLIPDEVELCTPIVFLNVWPKSFQFVDNVTVKIPHCALLLGGDDVEEIEEFVFLSTVEDSVRQPYVLECLEEDPLCSIDHFHVTAKLRHFSALGAARKKKRRKTSSHCSSRSRAKHCRGLGKASSSPKKKALMKQGSDSFDKSVSAVDMLREKTSQVSLEGRSSISSLPSQDRREPKEDDTLMDESQPPSSHTPIEFCIAMCTPRHLPVADGSNWNWEAVFFATYSHLTGYSALKDAATAVFGEENFTFSPQPFCFAGDNDIGGDDGTASGSGSCLRLRPAAWCDEKWSGEARNSISMIRKKAITYLTLQPEHTTTFEEMAKCGLYPPRVCYSIKQGDSLAQPRTCAKQHVDIVAEGSIGMENGGAEVSFQLDSFPTAHLRRIESEYQSWYTTDPALYTAGSLIHRSLTEGTQRLCLTQKLLQDSEKVELRKLIADLSFQLSDVDVVANTLGIPPRVVNRTLKESEQSHAEQMYNILMIGLDKGKLEKLGLVVQPVKTFLPPLARGKSFEDMKRVDLYSMRDELPTKICSRWMFVARLNGILDCELDIIAHDNCKNFRQQSALMLERLEDLEIPFESVCRTIFRVREHDHKMADACSYILNCFERLKLVAM